MAEEDIKEAAAVPETAGKPKKKHTASYHAAAFFAKIACTALLVWVLLTFVAGVFICHDNSSFPMIKDGDLCITYRLGKLDQGDLVVYELDGRQHFGRIAAFEGDRVELVDERVSVNGYCVYEDTVYPTKPDGAKISFPYTTPDNCVFVLNDYRTDINDSRSFGGIPVDKVKGKVVFVLRRRGI
ncbi:MAG: signal peptidase I [Ruminococcus sp.]|nr:signal peptidase I [Ruminococcus sp.]